MLFIKDVVNIIIFKPHDNPDLNILISEIFIWKNRWAERLSNLPKITQLMNNKALSFQIWLQGHHFHKGFPN